MSSRPVEELLARYVEHLVLHGKRLAPEVLAEGDSRVAASLADCIEEYERLERTISHPASGNTAEPDPAREVLPEFVGFRTIERIARGGGGDVYKLEDLELGRSVAAKVIRPDNPLRSGVADFLREARSLALFDDPRIVRVHEFRADADPAVLLMEYVDGFELAEVGRSLERSQQVRVIAEVADAIERAHALGIQHRDLKPANIMLDATLSPKLLDFGLSRGEADRGHGVGTLEYMAPEQIETGGRIDARTDVYALGVVLYELLCGVTPYAAPSTGQTIDAIRRGVPRLPSEIDPTVPEPLQAIALKAMEVDPAKRYPSAREMALELRRYLEGRPVLARPTVYQSALRRRLGPHLEQIREWLSIKLIYPHEAERLTAAYRALEARDDDWIVQSRVLSPSQIALYLGGFVLLCGSLLYFVAYLLEAVEGPLAPLLVLGLPFVGLNVAAHRLYRGDRKAVAVAFRLAAVILLPLLLIILLQEAGWAGSRADDPFEIFDGLVSNRRLQLAALAACAWSAWLALSTRTVGLSTAFTVSLFVFNAAVLADFGLRGWIEEGRYDLLAVHLLPLLVASAGLGFALERSGRPWFAQPHYVAGVGLLVLVLELWALDGQAFEYLGLSMASFQGADVGNPVLLDTLTAMAVNGVLIYLAGWSVDRYGTETMRWPAWLLFSISPFAILAPLGHLSAVGEYSRRFDWVYLGLALAITFLSRFRQRKSFYFAGLLNTGVALWYLTEHYEWFDRPAWANVVVAAGLAVLVAGLGLARREANRRGG